MPKPSEGKLLYHMTRLENMPSILEFGLIPRKQLEQKRNILGISFTDIADHGILAGREEFSIPLSDYVPFHFFAKNPFDGKVCRIYGAENMVIITIYRDSPRNPTFRVIPTHPLDRSEPKIYPYAEGLQKINWPVLDSDYRDYHDDEVKKQCMAECLVPKGVSPEEFAVIYVYHDKARREIQEMPFFPSVNCPVYVAPNMFP